MVSSILFNDPVNKPIVLGKDNIIESLDRIYNVKHFRYSCRIYMGLLLIQYFFSYMLVPFDSVENRPPITIVSNIYCLVMFSLNVFLLPTGTSTIPSLVSFRCLIASSVSEFIGVSLHVPAVVSILGVPSMYTYEYDESNVLQRTDVTTYLQVVTILSLAFNCLAFAITAVNVHIVSRSMNNLLNRMDRHGTNGLDMFAKRLPSELAQQQINSYMKF